MNTEMENGTQMTLEECVPMISPKQTVGVSDSHAKTSQSQESNLDFKETVQACFSELCTLSDSSKKKIDPLTFSLRTLRICLVLMEDGISPDCSLKWNRGGYDAEWQVLNSKDFGVPQNRERCFIIGHLRSRGSTEVFPVERADGENSISLNLFGLIDGKNSQKDRVYSQDGLAPTVSTCGGGNTEPKVPIIFDTSYIGQDGKAREYEGICPTLTSRDYKEPRSVGVVCNVNPSGKGMNGNVYDSNGVSPSLTTNKGEGNKIAIPVLTPDRAEKRQNGRRFKDDGEPMFTLTGQDRHGVATSVPVSMTRNIVEEEIENTLDTSCNQGIFVQVSEELVVYAVWYERYQCYIAIRKLTPKECFRLQGWTDDYFEKAQFVNSDSQLYKQAGNGVTVNVIEAIAEKLRFA